MARAKLIEPTTDLIEDSGSVLWSFIKGEQLEFPAVLSFLQSADSTYEYEAVVLEALNVIEQTEKPTVLRPSGVNVNIGVRTLTNRGTWDPPQAYNREELVSYNGLYYRLSAGVGRINNTPPDVDPLWVVATNNTIYLQFPSTLGTGWTVQPAIGYPVYGFFELRVTEPSGSVFRKTWKPLRGMVELHFSPTDVI
jgi:hypothetical protein